MELLNRVPIPLLQWYQKKHRILPWRDPIVPYHTWVSEIMLQQTRVEAVIGYYHRFLSALPTIADLANADEQQLLKLWEGLGYYNRVRNLQKAAKIVCEEYQGKLPADYQALQTLPGIGKYTAGAISSIAFGILVPAVDGNVLRVISRVVGSFENISKNATKKVMEQQLFTLMQTEPACSNAGDFVQALMELGAMVCVPNGAPKCDDCPLKDFCEANLHQLTEQIPVKDGKKARTIVHKTVFIITDGSRYAIRQRPDKGLLASLWELPSIDQKCKKSELHGVLASYGMEVQTMESVGSAKHIFTHIEWRMQGILVTVAPNQTQNTNLTWATAHEIEADYPLPSAFEAYRPLIRSTL